MYRYIGHLIKVDYSPESDKYYSKIFYNGELVHTTSFYRWEKQAHGEAEAWINKQ